MTKILAFDRSHIERAKELAKMNYNEERVAVAILPQIDTLPDLGQFADNGLGVSLFDGDNMLGFLCCLSPWNNAYNSMAKGTFTPIHAHGAIFENRERIYTNLYQAAAERWVSHGIAYHAIGLYAHNSQALKAFFNLGFGLRCVDAVRPLSNYEFMPCKGVTFYELAKKDVVKVRKMRKLLGAHLGESPCFMRRSPEHMQSWLARAEDRDSRLFAAGGDDEAIAFIEVTDSGENFATKTAGMKSIQGAFCMPEFRGTGVFDNLLNHVIMRLKNEGYLSLGVDFESFNPNASGFWLKHFSAYTNSVTRRIDECAFYSELN